MPEWLLILILIVGGYLLGSLQPAEWIFFLFKHASSRELGVKPGTFSVVRQVGILPGIICLLFDLAKGFLTPWLALNVFHTNLYWLPLIALARNPPPYQASGSTRITARI